MYKNNNHILNPLGHLCAKLIHIDLAIRRLVEGKLLLLHR